MLQLNKKITQARFLTIFAIIIILLIGGGILSWQYFKAPKEETKTFQKEINKKRDNKTINWKIYKNEKYKFEIKYPQDWIILHEGYYKTNVPYEVSFIYKKFSGDNYTNIAPISIEIHTENLKDASKGNKYIQLKSENEIIVNNMNFRKQILIGPEGEFERVFVPGKEKFIYELKYSNPKFKDIFYQMLSTFRFLE